MAFWQSQAHACGTLYVVNGSVSSGDPQAATTCFMQAYAHCHAATLVESVFDLDVPPTYTYLIEPQLFAGGAHACSIQVNVAIGGSLSGLRSNNDWVACADVEQRSDGLHIFGCGPYSDYVVGST
jgi:hypothetical protein